jgi:hypothetical protein
LDHKSTSTTTTRGNLTPITIKHRAFAETIAENAYQKVIESSKITPGRRYSKAAISLA